MKRTISKKYNKKNDSGQLLILAGILITILIVVSSILSVNLSITNRPSDKETTIRQEYINIREKFGQALNDRLSEDDIQFEDVVDTVFCSTLKEFKFALSRYEYFFDAELSEIKFVADQPEGLLINITMSNKYDSIFEQVYYRID